MKHLVFIFFGCISLFDTIQAFAGTKSLGHYQSREWSFEYQSKCAQYHALHPDCLSHRSPATAEEQRTYTPNFPPGPWYWVKTCVRHVYERDFLAPWNAACREFVQDGPLYQYRSSRPR